MGNKLRGVGRYLGNKSNKIRLVPLVMLGGEVGEMRNKLRRVSALGEQAKQKHPSKSTQAKKDYALRTSS